MATTGTGTGSELADGLAEDEGSSGGRDEDGGCDDLTDAPWTGAESEPLTSCPMIQASSTTATTEAATAKIRRRQ